MQLLTFEGPCIVIYFYSKTNQMHRCLKLTVFWNDTTCFGRSFRPSSGVQDCAYCNRHLSNRYCCLLVSKQTSVSVWQLTIKVVHIRFKQNNRTTVSMTDTAVKNALTPSTTDGSEETRKELGLKNKKQKRDQKHKTKIKKNNPKMHARLTKKIPRILRASIVLEHLQKCVRCTDCKLRSDVECNDGSPKCVCLELSIWWNWNTLFRMKTYIAGGRLMFYWVTVTSDLPFQFK